MAIIIFGERRGEQVVATIHTRAARASSCSVQFGHVENLIDELSWGQNKTRCEAVNVADTRSWPSRIGSVAKVWEARTAVGVGEP